VIVQLDLLGLPPVADSDAAEPPGEWEGLGCSAEPVAGSCLRVTIGSSACASWDDACPEYLDAASVRFADPRIRLDRDLAERADLRVDVALYGVDHALRASGQRRVESLPTTVGVPLAPVGPGTGCLVPSGAGTPIPRALHTATLLPTGQILLLGGVGGPALRRSPDANPLEESAVLLEPATGTETLLTVDDQVSGESGPEFRRALHRAAFVGREGDSWVVRVAGGVRGAGPAVVLSQVRAETPLQLLLAPVEGADLAPTVEVVVDPAAGTAVVREATDPDLRATYFAAAPLEDLSSQTAGWFVGGGVADWVPYEPDQIDFPLGFAAVDADGAPLASGDVLVPRVGAAAVGLGADRVLLWGGNVASVRAADPDAALAAEIAEIHDLATGDAALLSLTVEGAAALPTPAGLQAAAVARAEAGAFDVVVAGGEAIGVLGNFGLTDVPSPAVFVARVDPGQGSAAIRPVECRDRDGAARSCDEVLGPATYMTATTVSPGRVLLVGGNARLESPAGQRQAMAARVAAGLVNVTADGATLDPVDLAVARYGHTATLLSDGSVALVGGITLGCANESAEGCESFTDPRPVDQVEIWNPARGLPAEFVCAEE